MTTPTRTATPTSTLALAAAARQVQVTIRAGLLAQVARLWPLLDPKRLDETWPGWLQAMRTLITSFHGQSAQAAATFYRQARQVATGEPTPTGLIRLAPLPDAEWVTRALGYAGPGMLDRDTTAPNTALSTTLGTSARIVLDGGRTTTLTTAQADPRAVGYYRLTDGHPCAFCALLAGRGVVYKQDTASFHSHNDCGCIGVPAFSRTEPLPAVNRQAAQLYDERDRGMPALAAFRKAWDSKPAA